MKEIYQCGLCNKLYTQILKLNTKNYGEEVDFVFHCSDCVINVFGGVYEISNRTIWLTKTKKLV